ncbi:hypothetical protein FDECE_5620 [Fusarium decemcellulare]|nr:hypothetical protein FDECE_5620 [Fusarium decemcellulare]
MASMEPSEAEISQVIDFSGLNPVDDREMVTQALKLNNRNAETVLMQFFDNPDSFREKYRKGWNESFFSADRDGNDNSAGISFHIEASDHGVIQGVTPPPDPYAPGAPSRPPSRSNNRSPLGRIVDWTAAHVPGVPNNQAQEEDDVQRALRESAQEAGITLPQGESTFTEPSASAPYFGPANRTDYDQNSWAMVPVGPSKGSTVNEPGPSQRKRAPGGPALLVMSNVNSGSHKLGGLLTILHEIPMARNLLLGIGNPASSYGHNSDWWRGQEVLSPEILAKMSTEQQWNHERHNETAFDEEVHRLMAFLDSTERGYGSVSVLTDLLKGSSNGVEKQFYEVLSTRHWQQIKPLTQVASIAKFYGDGVDDEEDARFGILEMEHLRNEYDTIKTLYESLDHVMWSDTLSWENIHEGSKMAFFKEMGEVLVLNISGDGPDDSIEIPTELYPEKYLTSRKDEARRLQKGWCQTKREINRLIGEKERVYRLWDDWDNGKYDDKRELIRKALEQWGEYRSYLENLSRFQAMEKSAFDTDKYPDYRAAPCDMDESTMQQHQAVTDVIQFSEKFLEDIDSKMKSLDKELEQIMAKQRALGRLLTVPDKPGRPKPMTCKKYLLRGVATSPNIVYVCQREEASLIELDGEEDKRSDRWLRLAYTPSEEQAVKMEKIEIERVFRDMWQETKTPLLVYATEEAVNAPREPLSGQLERFIKAENKAFRQELSLEKSEANEAKRAAFIDPISPSKRKHRSDSVCSLDSNRASIGSDDRSGFDNPFFDQEAKSEVEMAEFDPPFYNQDDKIKTEINEVDNPPEYMHSFDASEDTPPALPARHPTSTGTVTETTSATMTPSTIVADHTTNTTPAKEEDARGPEMQERARPPSFMALSRNPSGTKEKPIDLMDMEISEQQQ